MHELDFVSDSVNYQLGLKANAFGQGDTAMMRALKGGSGQAMAVLPDRDTVIALNEPEDVKVLKLKAVERMPKPSAAIREIKARKPDFGFTIDMQDRRVRTLAEPGDPVFPSFTFNRIKGDAQRILWPLAGYHDLNAGCFVDAVQPDAVAWEDKAPRVVWRGATGGRTLGDGGGSGEGMRLKSAIRRFQRGKMSYDDMKAVAEDLPRWKSMDRVRNDPRFDFGFVDGEGFVIADTPFHEEFGKARMTQQQMQGFRYIAVMRGMDVGSSFYWTMNSGSVALVMDTPFETFASAHFRPWEHYIPFKEDSSDLLDHLEWARKTTRPNAVTWWPARPRCAAIWPGKTCAS